ncbi:MAG TPA: SulP family inorganic anion transporter [Vicingaceae bacterium]
MKFFFDISNLKGDFLGGLTAGIVALPLALAFGVSSGLGASAGVYGAIFVSFFAALFGGTNTQISGPTAPMTAVSMVVISGLIGIHNGDLSKALPAILMVFLISGIIQILMGIAGLGKYIKYIPYPVVSGFMTAIGVIILITQILPILGYSIANDKAYVDKFKPQAEEILLEKILEKEVGDKVLVLEDFERTINESKKITNEEIIKESETLAKNYSSGVIGAIRVLPRALKQINYLELILALSTIFIIYGFKKITSTIPSTLVALIVMTAIAFGFNLDYKTINQIPSGIPSINLEIFTGFDFNIISPYIFTAITLAFLGSIDSLLTSVVADNLTKTKHNANKELIGQGIGNSIASLFGGIPGAGATIRTIVNINSGGKTKLSGMLSGVFLLIVLLALGPIASKIPSAVLAGILVTVGIGVMDFKGLKAIPYTPKYEVVIMLVVLVLSTFWNLVYAVGIGLIIASLIFMKKIGDLTSTKSTVKKLSEETSWTDEANFPQNLKEEVYIEHINGPLFFGSTNDFQNFTKQIPDTASAVIIRLDRMRYIDQSGLFAFKDVISDLVQKNIKVVFVHIQEQPRALLERIKLIPELVPQEQIFEDFNECLDWIVKNVEDIY